MYRCCCVSDPELLKGQSHPTMGVLPALLFPPPTEALWAGYESLCSQPFSACLPSWPPPQASQFETALPLMCYSRFWSCGVSHLQMGFCTAWQKTFSVPSWWKAVGPREETGLLAPAIYRVSPSHHLRILLFLLFKKRTVSTNPVKTKAWTSDNVLLKQSCSDLPLGLPVSRHAKQWCSVVRLLVQRYFDTQETTNHLLMHNCSISS